MAFKKPNRNGTIFRENNMEPSTSEGLCVTCLDGCEGVCEVGRSAVQGTDMLYPRSFELVATGSDKEYPVDFSHFNIQGTCTGGIGIDVESENIGLPAVDCRTTVGVDEEAVHVELPVLTGAVGTADCTSNNWEEVTVGAAISGIISVIGENICSADPEAEIKNGAISKSPAMERRIEKFRQWYNGYGGIIVQANPDDFKARVPEYVVENLGIETFELKWAQTKKNIGEN